MTRRERIEQGYLSKVDEYSFEIDHRVAAELRALWAVVDALERGDDSALTAFNEYLEGQDD